MPYHSKVDFHRTGDFSDTSLELVTERVPGAIIYPGIFPDTLSPSLPPVAFVHADADQYQTTKDICIHMPPLMVKGGIIIFDDYKLKGCRKALKEMLPNHRSFSHKRAVWVNS
jgi:hypothetical protein